MDFALGLLPDHILPAQALPYLEFWGPDEMQAGKCGCSLYCSSTVGMIEDLRYYPGSLAGTEAGSILVESCRLRIRVWPGI